MLFITRWSGFPMNHIPVSLSLKVDVLYTKPSKISWETRSAGDEEHEFVTSFSEPPVLSDVSEETLLLIAKGSKVPEQKYRLPSHNQDV